MIVSVAVMGAMVRPEAVAEIVSVLDPVDVLAVVSRVNVVLDPEFAPDGVRDAVVPLGKPETSSVTSPVKSVRLMAIL